MSNFVLKEKYILPLFLLAATALRLFSFFPSVLDHDESTYLIIGRDILHGKDLYTDVTDTKPVGIFLFYAGLQFLFGNSILLKRLVFALVVGATGFLVYKVSKKMFSQKLAALASGIIYIIYVSIWNYHGRSPNTELLFNLCTIGALLLFLKPNLLNYLFGGLILGIGFIIKYLVLFDFAAFLLFFFIYEMLNPENRLKVSVWARFIVAGLAFLVPFGLTNMYFWLGDHFSDFYFVTYELPGNYGSSPSITRYIVMLLDFTAKFLPISFLVFYVMFKRNKPWEPKHKWFFILWISMVLFAIYIPGKEFSHYTIQLMLPFSLIAGLFFHPLFKPDRITALIYSRGFGWPAFAVVVISIQVVSFQNEVLKPDYEREVAQYISERMDADDKVFVSNYQQIIYYLLNMESPTKFVHSNLLFTPTHRAFNVNADTEIRKILGKHPEFVLMQNKNETVQMELNKNYHLLKTFRNGRIRLYSLEN